MASQPSSHEIVSSFFIGPKAENMDIFEKNIATILQSVYTARLNYQKKFPKDPVR